MLQKANQIVYGREKNYVLAVLMINKQLEPSFVSFVEQKMQDSQKN